MSRNNIKQARNRHQKDAKHDARFIDPRKPKKKQPQSQYNIDKNTQYKIKIPNSAKITNNFELDSIEVLTGGNNYNSTVDKIKVKRGSRKSKVVKR